MRIGRNEFRDYAEASAARDEFPECASCGGPVKIQTLMCVPGFWVGCMHHPAHRGLRRANSPDSNQ